MRQGCGSPKISENRMDGACGYCEFFKIETILIFAVRKKRVKLLCQVLSK